MQIKNSNAKPAKVLSFGYAKELMENVLPRGIYRFAVKPMMTALVMLAVAFGSWAATVSASFGTLPGDRLYSLKIMAEKTQLTFASSDAKPSLQVEFANRRLEEIAKIAERPAITNKEERTMQAVKDFNQHIVAVKLSLESLENSDEPERAVEVAQMVTRKTEEYGTALEKVRVAATLDIQEELEIAATSVDDAAIKAVDVIVKNSTEASSTIINQVQDRVKTVEERVTQIDSSVGGEAVANEAKAVLVEIRAALEMQDMTSAVDKLVEVKNLVNSAVISASSTNVSASTTDSKLTN